MEPGYDPKKVEERVLKLWEEKRSYEKLKEEVSKRQKKFLFIDGPPYASAPVPHIGTVWNKTIKDCILRYKRIKGYRVYDQPGYDTHGLPIEVKVESMLGIKRKGEITNSYGVDRFVNKCREFATANLEGLTKEFKNVGVFMDWDNPYITYRNEFISASWALIKRAHERGLLKRQKYVIHWCPRCETTLSDYEVSEYTELDDPSIYVKFKVAGEPNKYLLIWTTTPWTIPANVFVMVNGQLDYAEVEVDGEVLIIAEKRVSEVMKEAKVKNYKVLKTYKGKELVGLKYEHPLKDLVKAQETLDEYHVVVDAGDLVSAEEGTGLVHSATGHGDVDFEVGQKHKMPVVMFVNDRGEYTEEAGKYKGLYVRDANSLIIEDLRERNALFHAGTIRHRYPICWRCKTPLILRAVDQWYIAVSQLKTDLLREIDRVKWIPEWGKTRISNLVENIRDWAIGRQRFWGIPLPIWVCPEGHITVVGSRQELEKIATTPVPKDLHRPWIDTVKVRCSVCGKEATRVPDVADVWMDSGVAFFASFGENWEKVWKEIGPADLVLEGHDQLRGWFFSLLRSGVILENKAPYKAVLVHGFMLDEKGREMHKSLGNYVEPSEVISKYGRDALRLWLLRNTTWEDAKFSWKAIEETLKDLQIVWNVFVFASTYMSLDAFDPSTYTLDSVYNKLRIEDRWLLSRFFRLLKNVDISMNDFKVHELANAMMDFIINDVSRLYIRLIRKRAWEEGLNDDKIAMYTVLNFVLKNWLVLASTVIPFITEEIYQTMYEDAKPTIAMEVLPEVRNDLIDDELESAMALALRIQEASLNARSKAGIKLRWPLQKAYVFLASEVDRRRIEALADVLRQMINVKELEVGGIEGYSRFSKVLAKPNPAKIGPEFKRMSRIVSDYIESNSEVVARDIINQGVHRVTLDSTEVEIRKEHVNLIEEVQPGYASARFEGGVVVMSTQVSPEVEEEGIVRDVVRRIQVMRKQLRLQVTDYIKVTIQVPEDRRGLIARWADYIKRETRAVEVVEGEAKGELVQGWDIENEIYFIGVSKA
ncbi:MAG: isoleucine--tRNA ligase [Thermoprotei archaeon]